MSQLHSLDFYKNKSSNYLLELSLLRILTFFTHYYLTSLDKNIILT